MLDREQDFQTNKQYVGDQPRNQRTPGFKLRGLCVQKKKPPGPAGPNWIISRVPVTRMEFEHLCLFPLALWRSTIALWRSTIALRKGVVAVPESRAVFDTAITTVVLGCFQVAVECALQSHHNRFLTNSTKYMNGVI